jgi:pSer/pThr/pTyr-binding forkhead associated (FHA) protein
MLLSRVHRRVSMTAFRVDRSDAGNIATVRRPAAALLPPASAKRSGSRHEGAAESSKYSTMSFLIADQERYALRPGRNTLGGRGADAVALTLLTELTPAAVITIRPDGTALIQRISAAVIVKVDGGPLGAMPHPLHDGARISVGSARLTYAAGAPERGAPDETSDAAAGDKPGTPTEVIEVMSAPLVGGRLIELGTGCVYPVPRDGLVIGRGPECDIPVDDPGVSRRHAMVKPGRGGFTITDESANGTFVNGKRMTGAHALKHGDVLGIGSEEFRVDVDAAPFVSVFQTPTAASVELVGGMPEPDPLGLASRRPPSRPPAAPAPAAPAAAFLTPIPPSASTLALIEVVRGPFGGKVFRIERPVCAIGRGNHNDVRLNDPSVSSSHATLLLKRGTWYVVDLQSANGTYVDGYRVATERALLDGGSLRVGDIVMKFRLMAAPRESPSATRGGGGIWRKISKLLSGT